MGRDETNTFANLLKSFEKTNFGKKTSVEKETIKMELSLSLIFKIQNSEFELPKNY
jgi:hypothetical protein